MPGKKFRDFYELDAGGKAVILLDGKAHEANPTKPAGPATLKTRAKVSRTRREYGIKPRMLILSKPVDADDPFSRVLYVNLPILSKTVYDGKNEGDTFEYNGGPWTVASRSPEYIK